MADAQRLGGEEMRLASLHAYGLNVTDHQVLGEDGDLEMAVKLAAQITNLPAAAINIITDNDQVRIAATGIPLGTSAREDSFCAITMWQEGVWATDEVGRASLIAPSPHAHTGDIRSYASAALVGREGLPLGTLCAWSPDSLPLNDDQREGLARLADFVMRVMDLRRNAAEMEHRSLHDPLTGLPNRTLVNDRIVQALARGPRVEGGPLVVAVDLDHFKAVNDTFGHPVGDQVLVAASARLIDAVRLEDTVARYGGDEFLVVCERLSEDTVEIVLSRLRESMKVPLQVQVGSRKVVVPLACTIGFTLGQDGDTLETLVKRADQSMYAERERAGMTGPAQ